MAAIWLALPGSPATAGLAAPVPAQVTVHSLGGRGLASPIGLAADGAVGQLHMIGQVSPDQAATIASLVETAFPAVRALYGATAAPAEFGRRVYVWEDSLFTVANLTAFSGAPFDDLNVAHGGGAVAVGPKPGSYFSVGRLLDYGALDGLGTLAHEYAHVLNSRLAGGRPLPAWLDEGLAEHARYAAVERALPGAGAVFVFDRWLSCVQSAGDPTSRLTIPELSDWRGIPAKRQRLAYAESALLVEGLVAGADGFPSLPAVLAEYGETGALPQAWKSVTGLDYAESLAAAWDGLLTATPAGGAVAPAGVDALSEPGRLTVVVRGLTPGLPVQMTLILPGGLTAYWRTTADAAGVVALQLARPMGLEDLPLTIGPADGQEIVSVLTAAH